jgi:hypothetical protein
LQWRLWEECLCEDETGPTKSDEGEEGHSHVGVPAVLPLPVGSSTLRREVDVENGSNL